MIGQTTTISPPQSKMSNMWTYFIGELETQINSLTKTVEDWKTKYNTMKESYENRIAKIEKNHEDKFNDMVDHYEKKLRASKSKKVVNGASGASMDSAKICKRVTRITTRVSAFKSAYKVAHMQAMAGHDVESIMPMSFGLQGSSMYLKFMLVCNYKAMAELVKLYDSMSFINAVETFHKKDDVIYSSGITEEQLALAKTYHDTYIKGWVRDNCGHDVDSRQRKKIQDKWRSYLAKNQAKGCYSNLVPCLSTNEKTRSNKQKRMNFEFRKFVYWLCKNKGTIGIMDEIRKYVAMAEKHRAQRFQKKRHYEDLTSDSSSSSDDSSDSFSELEVVPPKRHKHI